MLAGVAALAGIGFTVSIFVTGLAFEDEVLASASRLGVLAASIVASAVGPAVIVLSSRARAD